jgi:integration host factor subunit alpha
MTLTKANIAEAVKRKTGLSRKQSARMVDLVFEVIKQELEKGENVLITNFGKFSLRQKGERKGRNPATNQLMIIPAKKVITFKCSGKLKDRINGKSK